jgi:FkbM family methyltransferase
VYTVECRDDHRDPSHTRPEQDAHLNLNGYASNLHLVERTSKWWRSGLPFGVRLGYYFAMAASFVRMAMGKGRSVRYLGRTFAFDNPATPLNLQIYPYEVGYQILRQLDPDDAVESVLDLGGNCGQFATTLKHFRPGARIDVVEPNAAVLRLLTRNTEGLAGLRIFPCALSPTPVHTLYVEPDRSCAGSLIRQNAGPARRVTEVAVTSADDIAALTGRTDYDLVKVDVEGYELEVLQCLAGLRPRYLFLELSAGPRHRSYQHSQIFGLMHDMFGDFDILGQDACDRRKDSFDVLFGFACRAAGPVARVGDETD